MNIGALREQHDEIGAIAEELSQTVDGPAGRPVASIRWRLARELIAHLAVEDRYLYPAMIARGGTEGAAVAARFKAEMGDLADRFTDYMASWSDARIAQDWAGFRTETRAILSALSHRIGHENDMLYPLAEAMSLDGARSPGAAAVRC